MQITINKNFYKKLDQFLESADEEAIIKGQEVVTYAVQISPVQTGAYVDSFAVVSRGGGSGTRSRSSSGRPKEPNPEGLRESVAAALRTSVSTMKPSETGGFTLTNRAPHASVVERRHAVFERTRSYAEGLFGR